MKHVALAILIAGLPVSGAAAHQKDDKPAVASPATAARGVDDPRAFVAATYRDYREHPNTPPVEPTFAYSDRLRGLFDAYDAWARQHDDLVGSLDFDWWMNAQDWAPVTPELTEENDGADRRTVTARFSNYGTATVNHFHFVRAGGRWYLDDVVNGSGGGDDGWTLSALLRERPE
jgi:hypothetical protein